jgi:hypothetical protein
METLGGPLIHSETTSSAMQHVAAPRSSAVRTASRLMRWRELNEICDKRSQGAKRLQSVRTSISCTASWRIS